MIGRLSEKGDTESSDPHIKVASGGGICQIISNNTRIQTTVATDLGEAKALPQPTLSPGSYDEQVGCTISVNLKHIESQDAGPSQEARSEVKDISSEPVECVSVETSDVMSVHNLDNKLCVEESDKTLQCGSINCPEQEYDPQTVKSNNDECDTTEGLTGSTSECDVNPIIKSAADDAVNDGGDRERTDNHVNIVFRVHTNSTVTKPENEISRAISAETPPTTVSVLKNETGDVEITREIISGSSKDVGSTAFPERNNKPNISVVKIPTYSKANVRCTPIHAVNRPHPLTTQMLRDADASTKNTVLNLNTPQSTLKFKNRSYAPKVQNEYRLVKTVTSHANGFVTKYVPSSQLTSASKINTITKSSTSLSAPRANVLYSEPKKDMYKPKKSRKMAQMSYNSQYSAKRRETKMDDSNSLQKYATYSNKLPNIISKIRDNLSENSVIKTKPNRKLFMSPEKLTEQLSVVRKYEPKYNTNNMVYGQRPLKSVKYNKTSEQTNQNSHTVSVNYEEDNVFAGSDSSDHYPDLASSELTNQEISKPGSKQAVRTGQNNNIDIMASSPKLWKQVTPMSIGTTIISETVTPITTSNTWDEVTRYCNKSDPEETYSNPSHEPVASPHPQILILCGDPMAASQRAGCDEEMIGEEIRPEPTDHLPGVYHSLQIVLQDHNYGAVPPSTSALSPAAENYPSNGNAIELIPGFSNKMSRQEEEDVASVVSIESNMQLHNEEDEETETAPEEENDSVDMVDDQNSVTRCICDFQHDDGYMIQCGQCLVWQHIVCVGVTPKRIPKRYLCDLCQPRELDRFRAHALQKMIRDDLNMLTSSDSSPTRGGDRERAYKIMKKRGENVNFPVSYTATRNKRIRQESSPKMKVRRPYKERKKVLRRKIKTDMDRPSVRPWLENYELAATNHYSQELRARLSGITKKQEDRPNFILTDCTTIPFAGGRIMISTIDILPNTPIIELMGKFMLSSQHQNATAALLGSNSRQVTQKPGPFVFFYRMPQEGTDVCVDTRTFGNEARFVRRSCKPNCELHHWFDKGTLHIYLLSIDKIESNTEITLRHEFGWHGLGIGRTPSNPCACNSPECLLLNPVQNRRNYVNESLTPKSSLRVGKSRGGMPSKSYVKSKSVSPKSDTSVPDYDVEEELALAARRNEAEHQSESATTPVKICQDSDNTSDDLRKIMQGTPEIKNVESPKPATIVRETVEEPSPQPSFSQSKRVGSSPTRRTRIYTRRNRLNKKHKLPLAAHQETKPTVESGDDTYVKVAVKDITKMTREERKIAQVMKVFDRLEKEKAKKSTGAPRGRRQDSESDYARRDESTDMEHTPSVRVYKKGKGRRKSHLTREYKLKSKRTTSEGGSEDQPPVKKQFLRKPNLLDGRRKANKREAETNYETSGTSSPTKMEDTARGTFSKRGLRKRKIVFPKKQALEEPQQGEQTEEAAGLLLALARSTPATPCEPGPSNEVVESPLSNMISVCQLVEAAVGPLETSLKSPKKAILNEWMNKSPESPLAFELAESAPNNYPESSSSSSNSPLSLLCLGNEAVPSRKIPSSKLLDTLVQAASSICDIGTSYPENDTPVHGKSKLEEEPSVLEKEPFTSVVNNEIDHKQIDKEKTYESTGIVDSTHSAEGIFNKPMDKEPINDEPRTIIKVTNASSINETVRPPPGEILNDASQSLKLEKKSSGIVESVGPSESLHVDEHIAEQVDVCENNTLGNVCDNSCSTDVGAKSSGLDMTTDLSNDSNVYSSYPVNNSGSAKKRWLHQALSEESDIPSIIEVSTPLKKRRLIRESTSDKGQIGNSDEINELPVETKNFQSATTVATSNQIKDKLFIPNKDAVVADKKDKNLQSPNCVSSKIVKVNQLQTVKSEITNGSAFDWEDLESHDEANNLSDTNNDVKINEVLLPVVNSSPKIDQSPTVRESPQKNHVSDELEDIHKRLQSFHSENIQVLRSRNQKPKTLIYEGQRKKVNLKFEVSILEDETVNIELCKEPKKLLENDAINANENEDTVDSVNATQIVSFDFDDFARHESSISQSALNITCDEEKSCDNSNPESPADSPQRVTDQYTSESIPNEHSEKCSPNDSNYVSIPKTSAEKCLPLFSFKDVPPKLEASLQIPLCSPTSIVNKHEIGVAARARLDSILNATDISQDPKFDKVLKKRAVPHIPNHIVAHTEPASNLPAATTIQTGHSKMARDPRLQAPKKKLSLTEYRARKKTDGANGNDVFLCNDKSSGQISMVVSDVEDEPNEQENFNFTPEPTLVERELEKQPAFLLRDFFTVPSSMISDAATDSETEESSPDPC